VQFTFVRQFFDFFVTTVKQRAQCHCPALTQQELDNEFDWNFGNLLQRIEAKPPQFNFTNLGCSFQASVDHLAYHLAGITFPSTCTSTLWQAGQPCLIQYYQPTLDIYLQLAVAQCTSQPTSNLPYISVTCSGNACGDLGKPCSDDTQCSGTSTCKAPDQLNAWDWGNGTNDRCSTCTCTAPTSPTMAPRPATPTASAPTR